MRMRVRRADRAGFKADFHGHELLAVGQDAPFHAAAKDGRDDVFAALYDAFHAIGLLFIIWL